MKTDVCRSETKTYDEILSDVVKVYAINEACTACHQLLEGGLDHLSEDNMIALFEAIVVKLGSAR